MKTSNIAILSVPMLVAGSIALSGCGRRSAANPTTISYSEVGICKSYATQTGNEEKARPNEGFAVFKIETVDNAKQSSGFNLDPERFFVDQTPVAMKMKNISFQTRHFMDADPRFAQAMGVKGLARAAFPANQKVDVNSFVIVPLGLNNPSGGPEANQYSFDLVYDTTTSEQQTGSKDVVVTKTNPADTKYSVIENCKELALK
ncbi:MAG: hypothetical protein M3Z96_07270 [Pseudomonadota bacterium]|nr:hypothetical protein [Pseudomonadota bacterium]